MFKYISKISVRVIITVIIGLFFASHTTLEKPCTSTITMGEAMVGCIGYHNAINYPSELLNNEQNSLVRFSTTFTLVAATSFVLLSVYVWQKNRRR